MQQYCFVKRSKFYVVIFFAGILTLLFSFDQPCNNVPELNKQIIAFVKTQLHKKVGTGECWDLAAAALNKVGAKWDGKYLFGKEIDHKKNCVYEGDIIQFEGIELKYEKEKTIYFEKLEHHTAVIFEVKDKGSYNIADQNTGFSGKKVGTHALQISSITKGKFKIFRPFK